MDLAYNKGVRVTVATAVGALIQNLDFQSLIDIWNYMNKNLFIGKLLFRKLKIESYFKPLSHYDSDFMIPSYESIIINS